MSRSVLFVLRKLAIGGAERVAADLATALVKEGHRVGVLHFSPAASDRSQSSAREWFPAATLIHADRHDRDRPLPAALAEVDADTLVLCGPSPAYQQLGAAHALNPALRIVGFMFNARQLIDEHRRNAAHIDRVICESAEAAAALTGNSETVLPVSVVPSGVDVDAILRRKVAPASTGPLTVGFVGRFDRTKNPQGFLRIAAALRRQNLRFVMAGPAPRQFTPPPWVDYRGALLGEDKERLLDEIDILVVPSRNDGRPLVIHEMQARGRVVVAAAVGAIPDLIEDGVNGVLCAPNDTAAFCAAIKRLSLDHGLRTRLGDEARRRVKHQGDWSTSLPLYLAAILGDDEAE